MPPLEWWDHHNTYVAIPLHTPQQATMSVANLSAKEAEFLKTALDAKLLDIKENSLSSDVSGGSLEENNTYLQYAPQQFRDIWANASAYDKELYMSLVEFTADGPNIVWKSGQKYQFAAANVAVSTDDLQEWYIENWDNEASGSYFTYDALQDYAQKNSIIVPT